MTQNPILRVPVIDFATPLIIMQVSPTYNRFQSILIFKLAIAVLNGLNGSIY